ncbi:MAG TPA: hypothetical protein VFZ69_15220 [Longimicrobiales bacterium]
MRTFLLTTLLLAAACGTTENGAAPPPGDATPPADRTPAPAPPTDAVLPERPATRVDTVMVEGTPTVETLTLVTAPADFTVPFTTYVPPGMRTAFDGPGSVRFVAAFGGTVNPHAYMLVQVHPSGSARPDAATILSALMQSSAAEEHEVVAAEQPAWALETTAFRYIAADRTNFTGSITIARHGDTYFHVIRSYPVEYGDGLPPRLHTILRHWRWEDTGGMLMQ